MTAEIALPRTATLTSRPLPGVPRVLLACDFFLKYTVGLASGLVGRGVDVALLTRGHAFEYGGDPVTMREQLRLALPESVPHMVLRGRVRSPSAAGSVWRTREEVRAFGAEAVHLQDSVANDPRLFAASGARRRRFALTLHDPTPHPGDAPPNAWKRGARRWLIRAAGLIFVHAEVLADQTKEVYSPRAPVVVIPHGIEPTSWSEPPEEPTLLFFGRVSYYKGLDVLLDAMPEIWAVRPDVRLVVAGRGHYPDHRLLGERRVQVRRGYIPDAELDGLFRSASAVVLPYREASQSGVGSHAREYGRALIATDVGGLPELVAEGTGYIVPSEDPAALARAVLDLLSSPERVASMGRAAAALSHGRADWQTVAGITLECYRRHLLA